MAEHNLNSIILKDDSLALSDPDKNTMIKVDHVVMDFNSAGQQLNSLKEYFIALAKRELMFKSFRALDDVSLEVQKGDVYGILGTNGSGKSTLLKIISGVLEPTSGCVEINGNIAPLIEMGAGFDFELTARENIYLNGSLLGYRKNFIEQHFDEIVNFAEINDFLDMPLKNYSSGMVSRIAFAIATVIVPEILIVDEVLAVGDFMFRQKCERRIQSLIHDYGTTVLIVSHDSKQIERLCNKAIWIEKGHMRMIGEAKEVSRVYQSIGGHKGTRDSEKGIFELALKKISRPTIKIDSITGSDIYSICSSLAMRYASKTDVNSVVIAPGDDATACICGLNLQKATNSVFLITRRNELPDPIASFLSSFNPKNIYMISHDNIQYEVIDKIESIVDTTSNMVVFNNHDLENLTTEIYGFLSERNCNWANLSFVAQNRAGFASSIFAPIFAEKSNCFRVWFSEQYSFQELMRDAEAIGSTETIILGCPTPMQNFKSSVLKDDNMRLYSISDKREWTDAVLAAEWVADRFEADKKQIRSFYIILEEEFLIAYTIANQVLQDDGIILIIDKNDMDSMNWAAKFITSHSSSLEKLAFIGLEGSFNATDKHLLQMAAEANSA